MKKITVSILFLFFLLAGLDTILHSPLLKKWALSYVISKAKKEGVHIDVDKAYSSFPRIDLENISIELGEKRIEIGTLKGEISLLRLLRKQVYFNHLYINEIKILESAPSEGALTKSSSGSPFFLKIRDFQIENFHVGDQRVNLEGAFAIKENQNKLITLQSTGEIQFLEEKTSFDLKMIRKKDHSWMIERLKAKNSFGSLKGLGNLTSEGLIQKLSFEVETRHLKSNHPFEVQGKVFSHTEVTRKNDALFANTTFLIPSLIVSEGQFRKIEGRAESQFSQHELKSSLSLGGLILEEPFQSSSSFAWNQNEGLKIEEILFESNLLNAFGEAQIESKTNYRGKLTFDVAQIHAFSKELFGNAKGTLTFVDPELMTLDGSLTNAYYGSFQAGSISFHADIADPFSNRSGTAIFDVSQGQYKTLQLDNVMLELSKEKGLEPTFHLACSGEWKHPLSIESNGLWNVKGDALLISLESIEGYFFNDPILLVSPAQLEFSKKLIKLDKLNLTLADAAITADFFRDLSSLDASLSMKDLPMNFLSLNPLDVAVSGTCDFDFNVQEKEKNLKGTLEASVKNAQMELIGREKPFIADGFLRGNFDQKRLFVDAEINVAEKSLLQMDLSLPIHISPRPLAVSVKTDEAIYGKANISGKMEDLFDYFDMKSHQFFGQMDGSFTIENTLSKPHLFGSLIVKDGVYQNYLTGTELVHIDAEFVAKKDKLILKTLHAKDTPDLGEIEATGFMDLSLKEKFPYKIDAKIDSFTTSTLDLVDAEVTGELHIEGNYKEATATGDLFVNTSEVIIPSRVKRSYPDLKVTFINQEKPHPLDDLPPMVVYPFHLDININAPEKLFIKGRGLESEWKGGFQVGGLLTDIKATGDIDLVKGQFSFSGRNFKILDGSLKFIGKENEMPEISITASIDVKDISILIYLKGPLNNPQVTLQSSPPLPMGTIMAYLLFGQDLADINSFQAFQIAQSIASIAGEGPSVLEKTKRSLGVDRVQIITTESGKTDGEETIAIEVGKYVTEDILVSLSQGAENSSPNIKIEVESIGGFSFLLESDQAQDQKQGKFSLRWTKTY